jgi:hypothetical protein
MTRIPMSKIQTIEALRQRVAAAKGMGARLMLAPVVALMCCPAFAALPTMPTPAGGGIGGATVAQDDWLNNMGAWFKAGLGILGLVLGALGFLYVVMGGLQKWKLYSAGRAEIGDLKEYFVMGAVLAVFMVVMIGYAVQTLA